MNESTDRVFTIERVYRDTLKALSCTNESITSIARNIDVSQSWLNKLANGHWDDPGIKKISRLHNYLFGNGTKQVDVSADKAD